MIGKHLSISDIIRYHRIEISVTFDRIRLLRLHLYQHSQPPLMKYKYARSEPRHLGLPHIGQSDIDNKITFNRIVMAARQYVAFSYADEMPNDWLPLIITADSATDTPPGCHRIASHGDIAPAQLPAFASDAAAGYYTPTLTLISWFRHYWCYAIILLRYWQNIIRLHL
jgi:hypothetical protein